MSKSKKTNLVQTTDERGGEGLRANGRVRRAKVGEDQVVVDLEDLDTAEIFQYHLPPETEKGTTLHEFLTKVDSDFSEEKLSGEVDLNALVKGKPCQFIVANRAGAGGKLRLEVVLVLPPNTLTHVKPT
jgi:hypothetical protein